MRRDVRAHAEVAERELLATADGADDVDRAYRKAHWLAEWRRRCAATQELTIHCGTDFPVGRKTDLQLADEIAIEAKANQFLADIHCFIEMFDALEKNLAWRNDLVGGTAKPALLYGGPLCRKASELATLPGLQKAKSEPFLR